MARLRHAALAQTTTLPARGAPARGIHTNRMLSPPIFMELPCHPDNDFVQTRFQPNRIGIRCPNHPSHTNTKPAGIVTKSPEFVQKSSKIVRKSLEN